MDPGPPRRRRPRPVADAPIDELLSRTDELAKGWLLALLEQVSLHDASAVPTAAIASDGPRICAAALRALGDDRDLRRLAPGGVLEPMLAGSGAFPAAAGPAGMLRSVDALHAVLWSALRDELRSPDPDLVYELAERLRAVTELIREAVLGRGAASAPSGPRVVPAPEPPVSPLVRPVPPRGPSRAASEQPGSTPVEPVASVPPGDSVRGADSVRGSDSVRGVDSVRGGDSVPPAYASATQADALWVEALEDEVQRSQQTGAPLSLLLVELGEGERLLASEPPQGAAAIVGRFAHAVRSVLRRQDLLASEAQTRVWVIARDTARPGARALADRVVDAVAEAEPVHGAPLGVNVGVAVLGEDAHDRGSLMDAAEQAAFTAAAAGEPVAEVLGPAE